MPAIDPHKVQIFFFTTPCHFPILWLARHTFVVINDQGKLSRFEVLYKRNVDGTYIYKDRYPAFSGLPILIFHAKWFWKAKLLGAVENDGDLTARMVDFIDASKDNYPYKSKYQFTGKNSNTYVSWILKQFPDTGIKLPWNCFGKKF